MAPERDRKKHADDAARHFAALRVAPGTLCVSS